MTQFTKNFLELVAKRNQSETEYIQAIEEVLPALEMVIKKFPEYKDLKILERLIEPERIITFRVAWLDDSGEIQINRGYRVQMNSAIGPYKGGLRFHPSVNYSVLKFLAFEQIFKNALTNLPMGAGKGGADFNPKGKSDNEIMRFCQAFMQELFRHIGDQTDVPAGDMGVGVREIGYMFGMYKKLKNEFTGILTGKGINWGGSSIRPEATGYGLIYFAKYMLEVKFDTFKDKTCILSGSGNVCQYAIEKILDLGGKPIGISDSHGYIIDEAGIDKSKLEFIKKLKNEQRGRIEEYSKEYKDSKYVAVDTSKDFNPFWNEKADCAFPCATENEIDEKDAKNLVANKVLLLAEGANMPCTASAMKVLAKSDMLYAPGKAANAGGVAVSGLEMTQNRGGVYWDREKVDSELQVIMKNIHDACLRTAAEYGVEGSYLDGANITAFLKVAEAMKSQGVV